MAPYSHILKVSMVSLSVTLYVYCYEGGSNFTAWYIVRKMIILIYASKNEFGRVVLTS